LACRRADRTWRRSAGTDLTDQWKDYEANDSGEQNQDWLGYFETYQNSQSEQSNQCGRPVEDGPLAQDKSGPGNGVNRDDNQVYVRARLR